MANVRRNSSNVSVRHGAWGEDVACEFLRVRGFEIIERNARPDPRDRRLEIDIVAWERSCDLIVFVEVKQHARRSRYARRLTSVVRHKQDLLRRACRAWLRVNGWRGGFRFDVIEVYGEPDEWKKTEIDHVERVRLFTPAERFVNWSE